MSAIDLRAEDLTAPQLAMVLESGSDDQHGVGHEGYGVELRGSAWATARSLNRLGLGWIQGDPGGELPGLYWNNIHGVCIARDNP